MRDKYRFQRAKNNLIGFVWKTFLAIVVIYVLLYIFAGTDFIQEWKKIFYDIIK